MKKHEFLLNKITQLFEELYNEENPCRKTTRHVLSIYISSLEYAIDERLLEKPKEDSKSVKQKPIEGYEFLLNKIDRLSKQASDQHNPYKERDDCNRLAHNNLLKHVDSGDLDKFVDGLREKKENLFEIMEYLDEIMSGLEYYQDGKKVISWDEEAWHAAGLGPY